jgi:hypothetical protein
MQLSGYISELLYKHDCVIIPGFGGFVSNYAPAKIHPVNHTFYPPSKNILFNAMLTSDDGLLLHNISIGENVSYEEAKSKTASTIREWMNDLNSGKTVFLDKIGKIRKDNENRFLFDSDTSVNYLESSFGLSAFISLPVQRTSVQKRIEKKFTDRKNLPGVNKNVRKVLAYVAVISILAVVGWLVINSNPADKGSEQSAMMTISDPGMDNPVSENTDEGNPIPVKPLKDLNFVNPGQVPVDKPVTDKDDFNKESIAIKPIYFIIGGAFMNPGNADKFLADLKQKGFNAQEAGKNPAGLLMISYFSSPDKSEALMNLALIRQSENPSAWLLRK